MEELGKFVLPVVSSFPTSPQQGQAIYHSTLDRAYYYKGGYGWMAMRSDGTHLSHDAMSESAAGTGTLEWTHGLTTLTPRGLLVLIVQNATAADQVTSVTVNGVAMEEVSGSPLLHSIGEEDAALYAYFLGRGVPSSGEKSLQMKITVSGAATKRAVAFSIDGDEDLRVEDISSLTSLSQTEYNLAPKYSSNKVLAYGVFHSGQDAPASVSAGGGTEILFQHDFGSQTAHWVKSKDDGGVLNPNGAVEEASLTVKQALEELAGFGVTIAPTRDFGRVTSLPALAGVGDRCSYIADPTNGVIWDFIYDGEGESPWKKIGGPPLMDRDDTSRSRANTAYGALTEPLFVTVPLKGDYDCRIEGRLSSQASGRAVYLSYAVGATAASDNWGALTYNQSGGEVSVQGAGLSTRQTGVAASAKIEEQARTSDGGTGIFIMRRLWVDPVRVG